MVKYRNVSSQNGGDADGEAEVKHLWWTSSVILDQPHELPRPRAPTCARLPSRVVCHHAPAPAGNSQRSGLHQRLM